MKTQTMARGRCWLLGFGVLLSVASCGSQTGGGSASSDPAVTISRVDVAVGSDVRAIRDEVYQFYDSWAGGRSGQQAAEVLISYGQNGPFVECENERGYDVTWEDTVGGTTYWDGLNATGWLRDPMRPRWSRIARADAYSAILEQQHMGPAEVPDDIIDACLKETPTMGDGAAIDISYPSEMERLMAEWDKRIVEATAPVTGSREEYDQCVLDGDLASALADAPNTNALTRAIIAAEPPPSQIPIGSASPTEEWTQWQSIENQLLNVESECAQPVYEDGMRALPTVIDEFEEDFGPQIAVLRQHWETVRADAGALGWSEEMPFLSLTPEGWVDPAVIEPAALD